MMYIATIFNEDLGDIDQVQPAESLDDAVAFVFDTIGQMNGRKVEVMRDGQYFGLKVTIGNMVIASIEDREPAQPASAHAQGAKVVAACNALGAGDTQLIRELFTG